MNLMMKNMQSASGQPFNTHCHSATDLVHVHSGKGTLADFKCNIAVNLNFLLATGKLHISPFWIDPFFCCQ